MFVRKSLSVRGWLPAGLILNTRLGVQNLPHGSVSYKGTFIPQPVYDARPDIPYPVADQMSWIKLEQADELSCWKVRSGRILTPLVAENLSPHDTAGFGELRDIKSPMMLCCPVLFDGELDYAGGDDLPLSYHLHNRSLVVRASVINSPYAALTYMSDELVRQLLPLNRFLHVTRKTDDDKVEALVVSDRITFEQKVYLAEGAKVPGFFKEIDGGVVRDVAGKMSIQFATPGTVPLPSGYSIPSTLVCYGTQPGTQSTPAEYRDFSLSQALIEHTGQGLNEVYLVKYATVAIGTESSVSLNL